MRITVESKRYDRVVLEDIDLDFPRGKATLIIGASGGGKSTLLKCLIGTTSYCGNISGFGRKDIAYIPQFPALDKDMTVYDTVMYSRRFSGLSRTGEDEDVKRILSSVRLTTLADKTVGSLSGGQKQRVSIAKELVRGKQIIVADELDTGLDVGLSRAIIGDLIDITHQHDLTTVIISHNINNVGLFDHLVILAKNDREIGRVAYSGPPVGAKEYFGVKKYAEILTLVNPSDEGGRGKGDEFISKWDSRKHRPYIIGLSRRRTAPSA